MAKSLMLTLVSVLSVITTASVVHLGVAGDRDVAINIDVAKDPGVPCHEDQEHGHPSHSTAAEHFDVNLGYETHRGFKSDSGKYLNFSNIPYAEPPVGDLRFKPPVAIRKTTKDINVGANSVVCPQMQVGWVPLATEFLTCYGNTSCSIDEWKEELGPNDYPPIAFSGNTQNEDCLTLDVMVPTSVWEQKDTKKAAVLVWIYGGGFIFGWKSQFGSPAGVFEAADRNGEENVIYVAMNYRLGAFGWLSGQKFESEGGVPNVGLYDQQFALQWVQDNIHLFGGDKDRVTVQGQSAGASSILHHITSYGGDEEKKPNFTQAILQSPAFFPSGEQYSPLDAYDEFLARSGAENLKDLQTKSTFDLMLINTVMTYYSQYGYFRFGPTAGGEYAPKLPGVSLEEKKYHKGISMILGHTIFDGLLFTPPWIRDDDGLAKHVTKLFPNISNETVETIKSPTYYPINPDDTKPKDQVYDVMNMLDDVAVSCNNYYLTEAALDTADVDVYRYVFGVKPPLHGADMLYSWYPATGEDFANPPPWDVHQNLARYMQRSFVNFVRNGNPNEGSGLPWQKYRRTNNGLTNRTLMNFGDLVSAAHYAGHDPMKLHRCAFWQPAPYGKSEDGARKLRVQSATGNKLWEL